ncbi:hypothetical protein [Hirschia maritima]|uniref:hypothetical protein n=1 Tax=Hirschia maritima TaxID=1121961 RepID=UPI00036E3A3E|nr:hypothetical protein [Hirschia maritima]
MSPCYKIDIKEKSYEQHFNIEIGQYTDELFAPDQCDEKILGFDSSVHLNDNLWHPHFPRMSSRCLSNGVLRGDLEKHLGRGLNKILPNMKFNLFIQFKRPEYLSGHRSGQWEHWKRSYYRFTLTPHQQELLEKLAVVSKGRAAVVYASPAFNTLDELMEKKRNKEIIDSSNIISAEKLSGHTKCTYAEAGNISMGHSEPVEIVSPPLSKILAQRSENKGQPFTQHIKKSADIIVKAIRENKTIENSVKLAKSALGNEDVVELPVEHSSWSDALLTIRAFSIVSDISLVSVS